MTIFGKVMGTIFEKEYVGRMGKSRKVTESKRLPWALEEHTEDTLSGANVLTVQNTHEF